MRTLRFIVDGQIIKRDPECDFSGLVPGTDGYLQAEFTFSQEWKKCVKIAGFMCGNVECKPQILEDGKTCMIPSEALKKKSFEIEILGRAGHVKLRTNRVMVRQNGGRA